MYGDPTKYTKSHWHVAPGQSEMAKFGSLPKDEVLPKDENWSCCWAANLDAHTAPSSSDPCGDFLSWSLKMLTFEWAGEDTKRLVINLSHWSKWYEILWNYSLFLVLYRNSSEPYQSAEKLLENPVELLTVRSKACLVDNAEQQRENIPSGHLT